tara:strand:+ start:1130 stop:1396 length:267 start_codon:yes stop_codon:yes gene_type:complete
MIGALLGSIYYIVTNLLYVLGYLLYYFYKSIFYLITLIGVPLYVGGLLLGVSTSAAVLFVIIMFFYCYFLYGNNIFNIKSKKNKTSAE